MKKLLFKTESPSVINIDNYNRIFIECYQDELLIKAQSSSTKHKNMERIYLKSTDNTPLYDDCLYEFIFAAEPENIEQAIISKTDIKDLVTLIKSPELELHHLYFLKKLVAFINENGWHDVKCFINLTFGDYCIAVPYETREKYYDEGILDKIIIYLNQSNCIENHTDYFDTSYYRQQIEPLYNKLVEKFKIASNSNIAIIPDFTEYKNIICELLNQTASSDKLEENMLLVGLLLTSLRTESMYCIKNNEDFWGSVADKSMLQGSILIPNLKKYLKFSSQFNAYYDCVWGLTFITRTMLSRIMNHSDKSYRKLNKSNFISFLPVITDQFEELTSFYTSHYVPHDCFAILAIPKDKALDIFKYLPAFIHEFFHYIPPADRGQRNSCIIAMMLHSVLGPFRTEEFAQNKKYNKMFISLNRALINTLIVSDKWSSITDTLYNSNELYPNDLDRENDIESLNYTDYCKFVSNDDTMLFPEKVQDLFHYFGFETLIYKETKDISTPNIIDLINDTVKRWKEFHVPFSRTYTLALKEIRSDLFMCSILNLGCREYIDIMKNEPNFAISKIGEVAESSILRFGFMVNFLNSRSENKILDSEWSLIINGNNTNNRGKNLTEYIEAYRKNIANPLHIYNIFDNTIFDGNENGDSLVAKWLKEIKNCLEDDYIKFMGDLYKEYKTINNTKDQKQKSAFIYE